MLLTTLDISALVDGFDWFRVLHFNIVYYCFRALHIDTLLTFVLFTEDVSRFGSRPLCFNATASQLTNVSQLARKKETVAVALFSTYSRNIAVRIG